MHARLAEKVILYTASAEEKIDSLRQVVCIILNSSPGFAKY